MCMESLIAAVLINTSSHANGNRYRVARCAMLKLYKASETYVLAELKMFGDNFDGLEGG